MPAITRAIARCVLDGGSRARRVGRRVERARVGGVEATRGRGSGGRARAISDEATVDGAMNDGEKREFKTSRMSLKELIARGGELAPREGGGSRMRASTFTRIGRWCGVGACTTRWIC